MFVWMYGMFMQVLKDDIGALEADITVVVSSLVGGVMELNLETKLGPLKSSQLS